MNWKHPTDPRYLITDDRAPLDFDWIERMLRTSYWAADRPRDVIERSWRSPASIPI